MTATPAAPDIRLTWSAVDPAPSAGLASCSLEVQVEGESTWTELSQECSGVDYVYDEAEPRTDYTFRLTAIDNADNDAWTEETASVRVVTKYYYFGGKRVAMRGPDDAVAWLHGDHLGSTSLATDESGAALLGSETWYYPFGEVRAGGVDLPTDFGYTGQREARRIGLYDFHARWYDPFVGRFIQADVIVPNPRYPQDFNRYSYVRNNPFVYIDPTGYLCEYVNGGFVCTADPIVIGATQVFNQTKIIDEENAQLGCKTQAECDENQRQLLRLLLVCGIVSIAAPVGAAAAPSAPALATTGGATTAEAVCLNDGDCTNEAAAVVEALTADGDPTNEISSGLEVFSRAAEFGIQSFRDLRAAIQGTGLHAHHIIEQRFASTLGINPREMLSVALTPGEHQVFTNAWRNAIGYLNSTNPLNTLTATREDIWLAAQRIYADHPDLLEAARRTIFGE